MLEAMLKNGIDVNVTEDQPQVAGTTLLMTACAYGFPGTVKMLRDCDKEVFKAMVKAGNTVLHYAMKNRSSETAASVDLFYKRKTKRLKSDQI